MDDPSRIDGICRASRTAFEDLYRVHKDAVFRYAYALAGRSTEAEDLVHDVFLAFLRQIDRFDRSRPVLPYLLRSVRHRYIDRLRSFVERGQPLPASLFLTADPNESIEDRTLRDERAERVRAVLRTLPEAQSEVVRLRVYGGLEYESIARELAIPKATVRSRYRAAIERLRGLLGRSSGDVESRR